MKLKFFAYIRDAEFAGCKEMEWPEPVSDLRALGHQLSEKFGQRFHDEFFSPDEEALGERIIIMINGRRSEFLQGLDTILKPTDTVLIFPVVAGG